MLSIRRLGARALGRFFCISVLVASYPAVADPGSATGTETRDEARLETRLPILDAALAKTDDPASKVELLLERAEVLQGAGELDEAERSLKQALELVPDPEGSTAARCLYRLAALPLARELLSDEHAAMARRAVAILEERRPGSLELARALDVLARHTTETAVGKTLALRSLAIKEKVAPESLEVADTLEILQELSPGPRGLPLARRALALRRRLEPVSADTAEAFADVAHHLRDEGRLREASRLLQEALEIQAQVDPDTAAMGALLGSQALIRRQQGDYRAAEALQLRALEIEEASGSARILARRLNNLAYLAYHQGNLEGATAFLDRGLALIRGEGSGLESASLSILADVAGARGEVERALALYDEALEILLAIGPRHPGVGYVESRKAKLLLDAGRAEEARDRLLPVVARAREDFPRTPNLADKLFLLAEAERLVGRGNDSARLHREALGIRETLAPGSLDEAESAHALGVLARERGESREALELFQRAVSALEAQGERLGGSAETRARFRGRYRTIFRDLERLLLDLDRPDAAFQVLERARSQGLMALMATRRLESAGEIPEALEAEVREADAEYDRHLRELATRGPDAGAEGLEDLRRNLEQARQRQQGARARVRVVAPHQAKFQAPRALDLTEARASLEPETLLLSYSLGPATATLYALGPGDTSLGVYELDATGETIRDAVERYRALIGTPRTSHRAGVSLVAATDLGRTLLGPVAARLERAERLLVVPDGALHLLPFSALILPTETEDGPRFLVETLPSHVVSSVTLYAALEEPVEPRPEAMRIVGFGDPSYGSSPPTPSSGDPVLRGAIESGLDLAPLPSSRAELEALRRVYADRERVEIWTGRDASESRLKAGASEAEILHLACHGFVDERFPLESGLALSMDPAGTDSGENGLLQAWEIFEELRLDAELVTLSACNTAMGREDAGEGILGLTWAFLYAGARSVLASLWSVNDGSTAELMSRFYGEIGEGRSKADALRTAQMSLLEDPTRRSPFYWAAFQLVGGGE